MDERRRYENLLMSVFLMEASASEPMEERRLCTKSALVTEERRLTLAEETSDILLLFTTGGAAVHDTEARCVNQSQVKIGNS